MDLPNMALELRSRQVGFAGFSRYRELRHGFVRIKVVPRHFCRPCAGKGDFSL